MSELPVMPCPNDDTLGALLEHALDEHEAARVGTHIDHCETCRAAVVAAARGAAPTPRLARATSSLSIVRSRPAPVPSARMGRYQIQGLLGVGGMGQVFVAHDEELERSVALKVLRPELARSASGLADRLVRESRLMAKVAHPGVITVYDVGREGDAVFIAMELIRGETLAAHLAHVRPGWRDIVTLFERAGQGLAAAHAAGIVHRDFKPENVLVETDGTRATRIVVTDFGIALATALPEAVPTEVPAIGTSPIARLTAMGAAGTPAYMAPEQLAGVAVDRRTDVFAFSVSLWEALLGERPFPGKSIAAIQDAMRSPPRVPRGSRLPRRLIRALERGLALDPDRRWTDMDALLRELVAVRSNRRQVIAIAVAAAVGLVGIGIATAAVVGGGADHDDPCQAGTEAIDRVYDLQRARELAELLDAAATKKLDDAARAWRATHAATCEAGREPAQPSAVAACLDARALEISAFIDDARRDGAKASPLTRMIVDPGRCADPPPGLLVTRVPVDPTQRRAVTELRYRAFAIEAARDRSDFAAALPAATTLAADATSAWPLVHAEILYLLGTTQSMGGDNVQAMATLREAAALAERVHHDYIAASSWIQLVQTTAFDAGDPVRALEYATYADAAIERIGRPADVEVLFLYSKGTAMLAADQPKDAEAILRRAVELAETSAPAYLAQSILGLGYLFEGQGRYADAAATYRRAMTHLVEGETSTHTFHERLAVNLAMLGQGEEAEATAREAVAIAERTLGEDNVDRAFVRATLAEVLQTNGQTEGALVEVRKGKRALAKILGERNPRYGEFGSLEGSILVELERFAEANQVLERACEVIAFGSGEESSPHAACLQSQSLALDRLGRSRNALAKVDLALAIFQRVDGEVHPSVASALVQRGAMRERVGRHAEAVADFEQAIAVFEQLQLEPGHLAGAKWGLGKALWRHDRAGAKALIAEAITLFEKASKAWASAKRDAEEWLHTNGRPSRR